MQRRRVVCRAGHGDILPNEACEKETKPKSDRKCNKRPCLDYIWKTGPWQNVRLSITVKHQSLGYTVLSEKF